MKTKIDTSLGMAASGKRLVSGHGVVPSNKVAVRHRNKKSVGTDQANAFTNPGSRTSTAFALADQQNPKG